MPVVYSILSTYTFRQGYPQIIHKYSLCSNRRVFPSNGEDLVGIKPLFLLAACLITGGCATPYTRDDHARELEAQMREVVLEDGVNEWEANVIAESYFHRFGPGCGVVSDVFNDGKFWVGRTYVGAVAIPTPESIRIDQQTGRVTWRADHPTIDDPTKLWW